MILNPKISKRKLRFVSKPKETGFLLKKPFEKELSFVIQRHEANHLHFDLRLELDGVLKSWALPKQPTMKTTINRLAIRTEDHPFSYKNFEGTIPKGHYGAGKVSIWDKGYYLPDPIYPGIPEFREALSNGEIKFTLFGKKIKGHFALVRMQNSSSDDWLFISRNFIKH